MSAFRGYLIRSGRAGTWIERDGFLISWAKDEEDARRIIREELTAPNPNAEYPSTYWVAFSTSKKGTRRAWRWARDRWFPISVLDAEQGLARGDFKLTHMVRPLKNPPAKLPAASKRRDDAERAWRDALAELAAAWDRGATSSQVNALRRKVEKAADRFDDAKAVELKAWKAEGKPLKPLKKRSAPRRRNPRKATDDAKEAERFYRTLKVHEDDLARRDLKGSDDATVLSVDETRALLAELTRLREVEEAAREVASLNDDWSAGSVYIRAPWVAKNKAALARLNAVMR